MGDKLVKSSPCLVYAADRQTQMDSVIKFTIGQRKSQVSVNDCIIMKTGYASWCRITGSSRCNFRRGNIDAFIDALMARKKRSESVEKTNNVLQSQADNT